MIHIVDTSAGEEAVSNPGPPLDPVDQPFGHSVGLAVSTGTGVLLTTARPGVWMFRNESGTWERRGSPLFSEDLPPVEEQVQPRLTQVTPSQFTASGIGMVGDSLLVQGWMSFSRRFDWDNPPTQDEIGYSLGVFGPEGTHLATIELPAGMSSVYMHVDPTSGHIYMPASEPFPQVIEYLLAACES
jgi:hypothetical protein